MIKWVQYIRHERADDFRRLGWTITDDLKDTHHGNYSVLAFILMPPGETPPHPSEGE